MRGSLTEPRLPAPTTTIVTGFAALPLLHWIVDIIFCNVNLVRLTMYHFVESRLMHCAVLKDETARFECCGMINAGTTIGSA